MILRCLIAWSLVLTLGAPRTAAQDAPLTFRADVELFVLRVQVRADRGVLLPDFTPADFALRVGPRHPAVLHAVPIELTGVERESFVWPRGEAAAVYQLSFEAGRSDCRQIPRVTLAVKRHGVNIRSVQWRPLPGCFPPNTTTRRP